MITGIHKHSQSRIQDFPEEGRQPQTWRHQHSILANSSQKLHSHEAKFPVKSLVIYHPQINWKQESPPAWTQEAYRPPCSKSLAGGYLPWGTLFPPTWPGRGVPTLRYPLPRPDLAWGVPTLGYPPSGPGKGTYPPPPGVDRLTNWNYYLPPSYGCGR